MKKDKLKRVFDIYFTFFKLGCFSFGGGYAMIPLIEHEMVYSKKWIHKDEIVDIFAVSESLPGAIALNSSAFVAYSIEGISGSVAALLGNLTPSLFLVLALSMLMKKYGDISAVQAAFNGIRPTVVGLIFFAAYKISKSAIVDIITKIIVICTFLGLLFFHRLLHPVVVIILGAVLGIVLTDLKGRKKITLSK